MTELYALVFSLSSILLPENAPQLDLVEFAAGQMAQSRAPAAEIVRRQIVDVGGQRRADGVPEYLRRHPFARQSSAAGMFIGARTLAEKR